FGQITEPEKVDLAEALHVILARFAAKLHDPDYNYIFNSSSRLLSEPQSHWYVQVRPRLVTRAGFEIGSGIRISPSMPEEDAAGLNRATTEGEGNPERVLAQD